MNQRQILILENGKGPLLSFFTKYIKYYIISNECLFITNNLHWGKHIEEICNKSYRTLGLLKRNLSTCPMEVKLQEYKGLIRFVLEYASTAWDPHQSYLHEKLEKVQKYLLHQTTTMNQAV